jgi:hypothetical protein
VNLLNHVAFRKITLKPIILLGPSTVSDSDKKLPTKNVSFFTPHGDRLGNRYFVMATISYLNVMQHGSFRLCPVKKAVGAWASVYL